jgi:hypothetical protein
MKTVYVLEYANVNSFVFLTRSDLENAVKTDNETTGQDLDVDEMIRLERSGNAVDGDYTVSEIDIDDGMFEEIKSDLCSDNSLAAGHKFWELS